MIQVHSCMNLSIRSQDVLPEETEILLILSYHVLMFNLGPATLS